MVKEFARVKRRGGEKEEKRVGARDLTNTKKRRGETSNVKVIVALSK